MALESEDKEITVQSSNVTLGERMPEYAREAIRKVRGQVLRAAQHRIGSRDP